MSTGKLDWMMSGNSRMKFGMKARAKLSSAADVLPFREHSCEEMKCQIIHDSIHRRPGWTLIYLLEFNNIAVGFGSVAIAGPWKDRPTVFEFYVLPEYRTQAFKLFEALLEIGKPQYMEIQSNLGLLGGDAAHLRPRDRE